MSPLQARYDRPVKIMGPLRVFKPWNVIILKDQKAGPCPNGPDTGIMGTLTFTCVEVKSICICTQSFRKKISKCILKE